MWKLELEDAYFRILDSKRQIAGYFDPDYGEIYPKENEYEIIEKMHQNHDKVSGGFIMVAMVKFGIFDSDFQTDILGLEAQFATVKDRIEKWKNFISEIRNQTHFIRISHTDNDMLSITFPIKFSKPTPLEKKELLIEIHPILDLMQQKGLL